MTMPGDNPIRRSDEDLLNRSRSAASFARQVSSLDPSEGLVIGVLGPWGSGKTSFVNLARSQLEDEGITILDFNPWMFSGAEQLVESFFIELASQLRMKPNLAEIGKDLEDYGEAFSGLAWLPLVGPWIERGRAASKLLAKALQRRKEGTASRRQKLESALRQLDKPLVVVLDDIDRLTTPEIRDIFKLIRLTASFPNVIYLAAFDRKRVEEALAEHGIPGRDYLEKILQIAVDLPAVPDSVLNRQVFKAIDGAIEGIEPQAPFDETAWPDVYMEIIRPLLRNMRDVRRYAAAVHGTVVELEGRIELVDVLALEAIRVFLPDVFSLLPGSVDGLTSTSNLTYGGGSEPPRLKEQTEALVRIAGQRDEVVKALVERLFPAGQRHVGGSHYGADWKAQWLRGRRVAHEDVLRLYLERAVGEGLEAFLQAEAAWAQMADQKGLDVFLRSLDPERLQDVIASLEAYEDQFSEAHAAPSITVLLNLLPELPERPQGMFGIDTRMVVTRVVYRLLKALPDEAAVETVARKVLPELSTLSAKLELIGIVGHREGRGHRLVPEAVATDLEQSWRAEVRAAVVEQLLIEPELLRTLFLTHKEAEPGEEPLLLDTDPRLTVALLSSARSETRSQSVGNRAVIRSARLAWDVLVELYGDDATIGSRLQEARDAGVEMGDDLIDLTERYLSGWRPEEF